MFYPGVLFFLCFPNGIFQILYYILPPPIPWVIYFISSFFSLMFIFSFKFLIVCIMSISKFLILRTYSSKSFLNMYLLVIQIISYFFEFLLANDWMSYISDSPWRDIWHYVGTWLDVTCGGCYWNLMDRGSNVAKHLIMIKKTFQPTIKLSLKLKVEIKTF